MDRALHPDRHQAGVLRAHPNVEQQRQAEPAASGESVEGTHCWFRHLQQARTPAEHRLVRFDWPPPAIFCRQVSTAAEGPTSACHDECPSVVALGYLAEQPMNVLAHCPIERIEPFRAVQGRDDHSIVPKFNLDTGVSLKAGHEVSVGCVS
jgi:hypothetical protein